jgi:hypothetical protein
MARWLASGLPPIDPTFTGVLCDFTQELETFQGTAAAALVRVPVIIPNRVIPDTGIDVAAVMRVFWPVLVRRAVALRSGVFMGACIYEYHQAQNGTDAIGYEIEMLAHDTDPRLLLTGVDSALLSAFQEQDFLEELDATLLGGKLAQALSQADEFIGTAVRAEMAPSGSMLPFLIVAGVVFGSALLITLRERTTVPLLR